jgi:HEAT repeat protein
MDSIAIIQRIAMPTIQSMSCVLWAGLIFASPAFGQSEPEPAPTLGALIRKSWAIAVYKSSSISPDRKTIHFSKIRDLKGNHAPAALEHSLPQVTEMDKSAPVHGEPGNLAVYFLGPHDFIYLRDSWCVRYPEVRFDKGLSQTYSGSTEALPAHVAAILQCKEETIIAATPREKLDIERCCLIQYPASIDSWDRLWRIKAGLTISQQESIHDESPYFVGWGIGGPEVVPGLIDKLRVKDWRIRARAALDLGQLAFPAKDAKEPLRRALLDKSIAVRICAARSLGIIFEDEITAIPVLRKAMEDREEQTRIDTLLTLPLYGHRAVPALPLVVRSMLDAKRSQNEQVAACWALSSIVSAPKVPSKIKRDIAASFNDVLMRYPGNSPDQDGSAIFILIALRAFGPDAMPALPGIKRNLDSIVVMMLGVGFHLIFQMGDQGMRAYEDLVCRQSNEAQILLAAVGTVGNRDRFMIPTYLGFLKSNHLQDRTEAAKALLRLDPALATSTIIPTLVEGLRDKKRLRSESPNERDIFPLIAGLGPRARPLVPVLLAYLEDREMTERLDAAEILGLMGEAARDAVPCLRRFLYERKEGIHETPEALALVSGLALWRIEPKEEYIDAMCKIIKGNPARSDWLSPLSHTKLDPFNQRTEGYGGFDRERPNEFEMLAQIGRAARPALVRLFEDLEHRNASLVRQTDAAIALAKLDRRARLPHEASTAKAIALLKKYMQASSSRQTAALALSQFGADGKAAVPVLAEGLTDQELEVRIKALRALAVLGPMARDAIPAVVELLTLTPAEQLTDEKTRSNRHRLAILAVDTLWQIDPADPRILPTLIYYLEKHPAVDLLLFEILSRFGPSAKAAVPALSKVVRNYYGWGLQESLSALRKIDPQAAERVWQGRLPELDSPFPPAQLSDEELADAWDKLGSPNEVLATRAMWQLAFTPGSAVPFLEGRVKPDKAVAQEQIASWIAELDSKDFKAREAATKHLEAVDAFAEPFLKRALEKTASAETRRRIESLRESSNSEVAVARRRRLRAVEVLENCTTSESRDLLEKLAGGPPSTRLTRAAQAALERSRKK